MHDHQMHADGGSGWQTPLVAAGVIALAVAYLAVVVRARHRTGDRPGARTQTFARAAAFLTGCALIGVALLPPVAPFAHHDFRGHMIQHLLLGMYAPLALVLGAPMTALLRALPPVHARKVTAVLRSRPAELLAHPVTALLLSAGSVAVVYGTPVYNAAAERPVLHWLLHLHLLLAGYLFAWVIAGPDPGPSRPGVPARLVVLGAAIALHASISQLMYGGFLIDVDAPIAQVRGGAELMYYGGDIAELLLAAALVATWHPARRLARRGPEATARPAGV
ncbi:cytochrome c oxidase assembly protein [Actinomadura fibrosa]|uniref:Cytochrome c oxidase assembly protein n=1 Tax=Actinomadura fibrosa TaxID=111802 RepID=A0ABW2XPU9_9ACTN|nr:cytochrome c oxidase assembly protein [Actinomadura fibrosa]